MVIALMNLLSAKTGSTLKITQLLDDETALMACRLGLCEGETIAVTNKIMGGPLIITKNAVEIALGRELCKQIQVEVL